MLHKLIFHLIINLYHMSLKKPKTGYGIFPIICMANQLWASHKMFCYRNKNILMCPADMFVSVYFLTYWGQTHTADILLMRCSNACSWMKVHLYKSNFHWCLLPRVQMLISQYFCSVWWMRKCKLNKSHNAKYIPEKIRDTKYIIVHIRHVLYYTV